MSGVASFNPAMELPEGARIALIATRYNADIVDRMLDAARSALQRLDVVFDVFRVPGAWELPLLAMNLAEQNEHDALVAMGCVIRGDTRHFEHVADECARGLMQVQLDYGLPVANAVLAVEQRQDALDRAGGIHGNKGEEAVLAALEMISLLYQGDWELDQ